MSLGFVTSKNGSQTMDILMVNRKDMNRVARRIPIVDLRIVQGK